MGGPALSPPLCGLSSPPPPALNTGEGLAWAVAWSQEPDFGMEEGHQEEAEREGGGGQFEDPVNYKLTLAKRICQQQNNNNKGICHLPLRRLNPVLLQLKAFNTH